MHREVRATRAKSVDIGRHQSVMIIMISITINLMNPSTLVFSAPAMGLLLLLSLLEARIRLSQTQNGRACVRRKREGVLVCS
jgi:hypothetical protein